MTGPGSSPRGDGLAGQVAQAVQAVQVVQVAQAVLAAGLPAAEQAPAASTQGAVLAQAEPAAPVVASQVEASVLVVLEASAVPGARAAESPVESAVLVERAALAARAVASLAVPAEPQVEASPVEPPADSSGSASRWCTSDRRATVSGGSARSSRRRHTHSTRCSAWRGECVGRFARGWERAEAENSDATCA
jgi:hypothetical protein